MEPYAQTNLQLYNQLLAANYSDRSLSLTVRGYDLAMILFSARYRANGKPFLAHLIGTASILATQGAAVEVVIAGLLHAAYAQGTFPQNNQGLTPANRAYVQQFVGPEVEAFIRQYTLFPWTVETMMALPDRLPTLSQAERCVVLMRLANELEDYADLGMAFCQKNSQAAIAAEWDGIVAIAHGLGYTALAEALSTSFQKTATSQIPGVLCRPEAQSFSYQPLPTPSGVKATLKRLIPSPVLTTLRQVLGSE